MMMSPSSSFLLCLLLLLLNLHVEANNRNNGCSVAGERGVTIDILSCGIQNLASCTSPGEMVPVMTVALADCWGASSLLMRCHSDGYWRTEGAQVPGGLDLDIYFAEAQPMRHLCQPFYINSSVCGRKPRYKSTGSTIHVGNFAVLDNRWPMVVGLKKKERYECSATLIAPKFLLTAAHCVVLSHESPDMHEDVRNLKVQLSNIDEDQFVAAVYIHPGYEPEQSHVNDLAIIRLDGPLRFNDKLYPACVDLVGFYIDPTYNAVTFSRPNGKKRHEYDEILQQADPSCQWPSTRCRPLKIRDTQFCGVDLATKRRLVGGSSGGPFMLNLGTDDSEEWTVSGVVSSITEHHGCDQAYTIFTAINSFSTWITGIVNANIPIKFPTASTSATFPTTTFPTTTILTTTISRTTTAQTPTVDPLMPGLHPSGSHSCGDNTIPMGAYQIQKQMPDGSVQMHHYLLCNEVASTYRGPLTGVATTRTAACPASAPLYAGFDRGAGPCAPLASGWRMTTTCKNGDNQGRLPASVPVNHIRYIGCLGLNDDRDYAITEYITSGSGFREELQQVKCCKVISS